MLGIFSLKKRMSWLKYTFGREILDKFKTGLTLPKIEVKKMSQVKIGTSYIDHSKNEIVLAIDEFYSASQQWKWAKFVLVHELLHKALDFLPAKAGFKEQVKYQILNIFRDCKNEQFASRKDARCRNIIKEGRKIVWLENDKSGYANAHPMVECLNLILLGHTQLLAVYPNDFKKFCKNRMGAAELWEILLKEIPIQNQILMDLWKNTNLKVLILKIWATENNYKLFELVNEFFSLFPAMPKPKEMPKKFSGEPDNHNPDTEPETDDSDEKSSKGGKSKKKDKKSKEEKEDEAEKGEADGALDEEADKTDAENKAGKSDKSEDETEDGTEDSENSEESDKDSDKESNDESDDGKGESDSASDDEDGKDDSDADDADDSNAANSGNSNASDSDEDADSNSSNDQSDEDECIFFDVDDYDDGKGLDEESQAEDVNQEAKKLDEPSKGSILVGRHGYYPRESAKLEQNAEPYVGDFAVVLESLKEEKSRSYTDAGRFSTRKYLRNTMGTNFFQAKRHQAPQITTNYKLTVIFDTSGSMLSRSSSGVRKSDQSQLAAMVIHKAFRKAELPYQLLCSRTLHIMASDEMDENRCETLIAGFIVPNQCNGDGYISNLPLVFKKLAEEREVEHLVICLTDGCWGGSTAYVIEDGRKQGITAFGVGIDLSAGEALQLEATFGKDYTILATTSDPTSSFAKQISSRITEVLTLMLR